MINTVGSNGVGDFTRSAVHQMAVTLTRLTVSDLSQRCEEISRQH